mmetsp:Transcript_263/g.597  ORF Transcript_263/g.597 Transcript_263/m.597 type:complete len:99 (-) Transcript_263:428-724(-)
MLANIDKAEVLENKAAELSSQAKMFHKTARDTKRAMCKQNAKMNLLLGGCPSWFYVLCQSHTCMPRASNTNGCALFIGLGECGWSMGPETTEYTQMHM